MLLGLDDYKHSASPSVSSPESHNSDSSVEISDARRLPLFHGLIPPGFLPPHNLLFPPGYPPLYPSLLQANNNNNRLIRNHNPGVETFSKRVFLDAILQSQRTPTPPSSEPSTDLLLIPSNNNKGNKSYSHNNISNNNNNIQDDPIDLSMKTGSERGSSPSSNISEKSDSVAATERAASSEADDESDYDSEKELKRIKLIRPTPLDLTTKV